jgi:hypothetical protein
MGVRAVAIAAGSHQSMAVSDNGELYQWGLCFEGGCCDAVKADTNTGAGGGRLVGVADMADTGTSLGQRIARSSERRYLMASETDVEEKTGVGDAQDDWAGDTEAAARAEKTMAAKTETLCGVVKMNANRTPCPAPQR